MGLVDSLLQQIYALKQPGDMPQRVALCRQALALIDHAKDPEQWADLQNRLGVSLNENPLGDRAENLELAIAAYTAALTVYTREQFPVDWAMTQGTLARALQQRWELTGDLADLEQAISLLQEELTVAVPGSPYFINDQYALGSALLSRYEQTQQREDLEAAVQAYETAFQALSPEHYDRSFYIEKVGNAQSALGAELVREGKWHEGLEFLLSSLDKLQQSEDLQAHANALYQTGRANELMSNLATARTCYRDALRLYQHLEDKEGIARSQARLGSVLVSCGYLEKGVQALTTAHALYQDLQQPAKAAEIMPILMAAQTILQGQTVEEPLDV